LMISGRKFCLKGFSAFSGCSLKLIYQIARRGCNPRLQHGNVGNTNQTFQQICMDWFMSFARNICRPTRKESVTSSPSILYELA
jgi:hypothetical protein